MAKCNKCGITWHDGGVCCADDCDKVSKKMTTKISLEKFAEKLSDHRPEDLIEMLYGMMSDDDLIEMAAEEEDEEEEDEEEDEEEKVWRCPDCQEDEEEEPDCEVCHEKTLPDCRHENVCCCDGCHIRVMCQDCGGLSRLF